MTAARNDLVSNAWKRGLVGYRILVGHFDLYYKSPLLSKILRNFLEIVDILEYNWIQKGFFKFPNGISALLSTNSVVEGLRDAHKLLCTALYKGQTDKETGKKISFFRFPEDEDLMKQWIHAIRRDVGSYFSYYSVNEGTRVCSRHFNTEHLRKSLNGRASPRPELCLAYSHGSEVRLENDHRRHHASRLQLWQRT